MQNLNDDCLAQIFGYLPLQDQISISQLSPRFCSIMMDYFWTKKFRKVTTLFDLTCIPKLEDYVFFFANIASIIQELVIENHKELIYSSYLCRFRSRPSVNFYFSLNYPQLKRLIIQDETIHSGSVRLLGSKCPMLEELQIASEFITGAYIKNIPNLKILIINQCAISEQYLNEILNTNEKLEILEVVDNRRRFEWEPYKKINNTSLKNVKISSSMLTDSMAIFVSIHSNIEIFTIVEYERVSYQTPPNFLQMATTRINTLEIGAECVLKEYFKHNHKTCWLTSANYPYLKKVKWNIDELGNRGWKIFYGDYCFNGFIEQREFHFLFINIESLKEVLPAYLHLFNEATDTLIFHGLLDTVQLYTAFINEYVSTHFKKYEVVGHIDKECTQYHTRAITMTYEAIPPEDRPLTMLISKVMLNQKK